MLRVINSVELSAEPTRRVKLAPVGEWKGHPQIGVQTITPERAKSIVDQFNEHYAANDAKLVVDFNHSTILALKGLCKPEDAKASGWLDHFTLENGEPWADVGWTANAEALIRAREFMYLSPVFEFDVKDRKSGRSIPCRLHSVALTNKPFLTELPAVANAADAIASLYGDGEHTRASAFVGFAVEFLVKDSQAAETVGPTPSDHAVSVADPAQFSELRCRWLANGLTIFIGRFKESDKWDVQGFRFDKEKFTPGQAQAWLDEHKVEGTLEPATQEVSNVDVKQLAKLVGLADDATEDACKAALAELKAKAEAAPPLVAANVAELLDVPADATLDAIKERVEKMKRPPEGGTTNADPAFEHVAVANGMGLTSEATLDEMLTRLAELNGAVVNSDAELLVGKAVADGKVPPADKARWIAEAKRDQAATAKLIANMAPLVGRTAAAHKPADDGLPELTAEEERLCKLCGNDPMAVRKAKAARGG